MQGLRKLCDERGLLLIFDEVQTGCGRTGNWFAYQQFGVTPDAMTLAKALCGGIAGGALMAKPEIAPALRPGMHAATFGGNPIACAAALATFELIENEYLANAEEVGQYTLDALEEIQARHPSIGDVRGKGLMIGVEFVENRETKEPAKHLYERVVDYAFERGLLLLGCGKSVIRVAPALSINKSEIDEGLQILEEAVTLAEKEGNAP